jgi:NarL family two-component system response regulator LiaR
MNRPITVLIADDHQVVREGIRAYLQTQPDLRVVAEAADGAEAVHLAGVYTPDVTLLDLVMPQMDGITAIRGIHSASPHTQIIILSSFHDDAHIFPAIKAGALSYLLKDVSPKELADAIRRTMQNEAVLHPKVATRLVNEVRADRVPQKSPFAELSDRELEVLHLIAAGMSNAQIAEKLVLSEKTIKSYVSNILDKLQLADRTQAAVLAWREGIVQKDR